MCIICILKRQKNLGKPMSIQPAPVHSTNRQTSSDADGLPPQSNPGFSLLTQVLNEISHGMMLVCETGELRFANRVATLALKSMQAISLDHHHLRMKNPFDQACMVKALQACRHGKRSMVSVSTETGEAFSLAIVPMSTRQTDSDEFLALVTLSKSRIFDLLSLQFYVQSHQLTGAERNILQNLCEGLRVTEIASKNKVAYSTVRTHINSIFQKTQVKSIREIVSQVMMLPPMVLALDCDENALVAA
jgi:DNA-binding NarL/FixJ family response regulator